MFRITWPSAMSWVPCHGREGRRHNFRFVVRAVHDEATTRKVFVQFPRRFETVEVRHIDSR
jgi:hypothetical protein